MADSDLLKEAIADAKAVRETALANARMAIEEAFTPRIQSMISNKLAEELDEEEEIEEEVEEDEVVEEADDEEDMENDEEEDEEEDDEDMEESVNESEDDLDLDAIIAELESEIEDSEVDVVSEEEEDDEDEDEEEEEEMDEDLDEDVDIDIDELLRELEDMDDLDDLNETDTIEELRSQLSDTQAELAEYRSTLATLKSRLQETNLLNSKLFYTNKIFRSHELDNDQKVKVIENLDRAKDVREVKLVYATLIESFSFNSGGIKKRVDIHEALNKGSSKITESVKPDEGIVDEGSTLRNRFQALAGIKHED